VRTVAVLYWVKQSGGQWTCGAGITKGPLLRPVSKAGKVGKTALGDWSVVESCAKEVGIKDFGPIAAGTFSQTRFQVRLSAARNADSIAL
jgi:hypothetical protein